MKKPSSVFRSSTEPPFDLTPLIDIVFLLLVFFLVATTFVENRAILDLELPSVSASARQVPRALLRVEVSAESLAVNGKPVALRDLPSVVKTHAHQRPEVLLAADRTVAYERVVAVLDALAKAGVRNVALEGTLRAGG
ncbi:MAG: hypothetical protein KatS3mg076_2951 [Candidatus Binatia bacterium]|nr:MAG: hypothetical protein KatS3mg076_2951 [Candidatus Binatia bacterium]